MKNYLLFATVLLFTCAGYGKDLTTQSSIPTYQSNNQTKANHFSERESQERSYIDTADDELRALPKSKPKRHIFAKTVLGLAGVFVVGVFVFIIITGGFEFKY